jgi:hypothetical protein
MEYSISHDSFASACFSSTLLALFDRWAKK